MSVALFTHPAALAHDTGPEHPECADRLRHVLRALETPEFTPLLREQAPKATPEQLKTVHDGDYVDAIFAMPQDRVTTIDGDTVFGPGTLEAALRAAGGAVAAVDAVMEGWAQAAFVAMRPPGHHAEYDRAMGFCFFNNAAVAARQAQRRWGLQRVAVVDFDVHHGNGTQAIAWEDADFFFGSSHQYPFYPGTGDTVERGRHGQIVNAPLAAGSGRAEFEAAWSARILPALDAFRPDCLIISAGFDAHRDDPLAQINLAAEDFAWVTEAILAVADRHTEGRVVSVLEGGYDLDALAASVAAHVRALLNG